MRALTVSAVLIAALAAAPLTAQTASLVKDINTESDTAGSFFERLTAVGPHLFFTATGPVAGKELWVSDGTAAGTFRLAPGVPLGDFIPFEDAYAFAGCAPSTATTPDCGLWRTDGRTEGTARIKDLGPVQIGKLAVVLRRHGRRHGADQDARPGHCRNAHRGRATAALLRAGYRPEAGAVDE
jgi:ELWxxDGT repeat protein